MAERWLRCAEVFKSQRVAARPAKRYRSDNAATQH
jgi:hypothetical protein